jgi:hypothetical protein
MKKQALLLSRMAGIAGILFLSSCKKDYACECVVTVSVPGYTIDGETFPPLVTTSSVTNTFKSKKKDAEAGCNQGESVTSYTSPFVFEGQGETVESVTCSLK